MVVLLVVEVVALFLIFDKTDGTEKTGNKNRDQSRRL